MRFLHVVVFRFRHVENGRNWAVLPVDVNRLSGKKCHCVWRWVANTTQNLAIDHRKSDSENPTWLGKITRPVMVAAEVSGFAVAQGKIKTGEYQS